jgi:hypothetical protein
MGSIPKMDQALPDIEELFAYGRENREIAQSISDLLKVGTPLLRIDRDQSVATGTGDFEVVYQLSEGMMALLTAIRGVTPDRQEKGTEKRVCHGLPSDRTILPSSALSRL